MLFENMPFTGLFSHCGRPLVIGHCLMSILGRPFPSDAILYIFVLFLFLPCLHAIVGLDLIGEPISLHLPPQTFLQKV